MNQIYNLTAKLAELALPLSIPFNSKMKQFIEGRRETFGILENKIGKEDNVIWFHMASLGEFEQGVPILNLVRTIFPTHKIVVSFFSPSGYEQKKNTSLADAVVYLPIDTQSNAEKFIDHLHPELVIFIKYEFWPNYLRELNKRKIKTLLVSGGFRQDQLFFKSYGSWMRKSLESFEHFFVQNKESEKLLRSIGFTNVTVSGDTRFDRVAAQLAQNNTLEFVEEFTQHKLCVVAGSTWPEDEELLVEFINNNTTATKFIIAPHQIKPEAIVNLKNNISKKSVLFSEKESKDLKTCEVLIIDTIGLLTRIYNYADIAYVGGAMGHTGLHNILEAATFGIPVITGKNINKFPEALRLRKLAGLYTVNDQQELCEILSKFIEDNNFRERTGMISGHFISSNTGATRIIEKYIRKILC